MNKCLIEQCKNMFNVTLLGCDSMVDNVDQLKKSFYKSVGSDIHLSDYGISHIVNIIKSHIHKPHEVQFDLP